ncbi:MAG: zf-TFIIB domain-containing protein [Candidatus Absconditabacterales bacterium]|nr:zf-TFIIB domain-containing protein [Candidatus Absconditabacterales bacterium]
MKCPVCTDTNLIMTDRQGIEIDYCPRCRGVWLDRGELDKLIERSTQIPMHTPIQSPMSGSHTYPQQQGHHHPHHPHKKESRMSEIFDFDIF